MERWESEAVPMSVQAGGYNLRSPQRCLSWVYVDLFSKRVSTKWVYYLSGGHGLLFRFRGMMEFVEP